MTRFVKLDDDTEIIASPLRALGLCATCNHMGLCTSRKDYQPPVLYCEEFDDHVEPLEAVSAQPLTYVKMPDPKRAAEVGLCVNCAHREDCSLCQVEGGVWHCEEYA
jgi:hypothetical protein